MRLGSGQSVDFESSFCELNTEDAPYVTGDSRDYHSLHDYY
jgi:hypothetical protein